MPKVDKPDTEWREQLSEEAFEVTRRAGTERAFTGRYWDNKAAGAYRCVCCGAGLFSSAHKYDSGSGWPSFWQPDAGAPVATDTDTSLGMRRVEVRCADCDAHLGHVFEDGPKPSGERFCINSAALRFEPDVHGSETEEGQR